MTNSLRGVNSEIILNAVYYVESSTMEVGHIAIRPTFRQEKALWEDTSNRMIVHLAISTFNSKNFAKENKQLPEKIELVSKDGDKFVLQKMTLELYNEKIRDKAVGQPQFATSEELQKYYLETDFLRYST